MNTEHAIEILNELLDHESKSVLPRIGESELFTTWASADEHRIISRMIEEEKDARARLVETIRDLGSDPLPVTADIASTNIHYLDLSYVLPAILNDRKRVLSAYQSAASQTGTSALAAQTIAEIMDCHQRQIDELSPIVARLQSTS